MTGVKWIKITTDIFDNEKFHAIESLPDGYLIEIIWFKLLCLAGRCNQDGFLIINNKIAYTDEMLSKIFRLEIGIVQRAIEVFKNLDMVEVVNDSYMVSNWLKYQNDKGLEELRKAGRERTRRFRERQKEKLIDKESEEKKESGVTSHATSQSNVIPSISNSYSFSTSSNIDNYIYILDNYKDKDYIDNDYRLDECIREWLIYKDGKKPKTQNHYSTELSMTKLLNKFVKETMLYGVEAVVAVVDESIGNNYQGIVWDKLSKMKPLSSRDGKIDWESV